MGNPVMYYDITGKEFKKRYIDNGNELSSYYTYYDKDDDSIYKPTFSIETRVITSYDNDSVAEVTDMIFKYSKNPIADMVTSKLLSIITSGLSDYIPQTESYILKDECGRSLNIDVGDKVYITTVSWSYTTAYGFWTTEQRVKVVRDGEVIFNDVYYQNY